MHGQNHIKVILFLLVVSLGSETHVPAFRNTLFHIHRWCKYTTHKDGTECSETSAHKIQTQGNQPKERILHKSYWEHM